MLRARSRRLAEYLRVPLPVILLSPESALVFVLAETGVRGHLTVGQIERGVAGGLDVFDAQGDLIDYLSGRRIRSWCVVDALGKPLDGYRQILPEDLPKLFPDGI